MSELSAGWVNTTIGEVTTDAQQRIPQPKEKFTYIDISSIDRETKRILSPQNLSGENAPSRARKIVLTDDVLVSMTRPNLNAVAIVPAGLNEQIASTGFDVLRATGIEARWLYYLVRSSAFVSAMSDLVQGALYPAVRCKDVRGFEFALPPLNEQKRITAKLDALLARVDACREHLERVPLLLKRFRQAVLAAAISGRLTEDWRAGRGERFDVRSIEFDDDSVSVPYSWEVSELNELINPKRPLCYGVVQPGKEVTDGVSLIRVQDLDRWGVLANSLRTISTDIDAEYRRSRVEAGDLLVSVVGTIGRTAIVPAELKANIARAIARVSCRDGVLSQWVNIWLSSDLLQWWLMKSSREVARKTLNLSELGATRTALPPVGEQREIVRRVETLFAYADRLEARYQAARDKVEQLTPALLAKAFRGELVPQDPNDEPAAVLLERIKATRSAEAKPRPRAAVKPVAAPIKADAAATTDDSTTLDEIAAGLAEIIRKLPRSPLRKVEFDPANGHRPAPPDIDDYDRETLLGVIREVFTGSTQLDADGAIRAIARRLGYARTGARIHERLKNTLRVAVQRGILCNGQGEYRLDRRAIADYSQDECVAALLASMSRGWTEREEAIRAAARYLGFRRTGPALREAFKSAINGAIRRGLLEHDRGKIRKIS